jgi:micrococcal nuclease
MVNKSCANIAPLPNPSPAYGRGTKIAYHNPRPQAGEGARQRGRGTDVIYSLNLKQIITALATAYLLACSLPAFSAEITYFYDGDTVKINDNGAEFKLRINDIDAPEKNQSYGKKSRRALMQLCESGEFKATITGQDKYGRKLGKLVCHGEDASLYMVQNGYAWFYAHYSNDGNLAFAQQEARNKGLGLWHAKQQTEPWIWRKSHAH